MDRGETNGAQVAQPGEHDPARYVATLYGLLEAERSGVLEVESGPRWRRLYLLAGVPAWYESNVEDEGLARTLVSTGALNRTQLNWLHGKLTDGEKLEHALVAAGALTPAELEKQLQAQVARGYAAPLSWAQGVMRFTPCDALGSGRVDPALRIEIEPLAALWEGVKLHIQMDNVLGEVTDPDAGPVLLDVEFTEHFPRFGVEEPFSELAAVAGDEPTVEELFKRIPDRSGNLAKLLWLLQTVSLVRRPATEGGVLDEVRRWIAGLRSPPERVLWVDEDAGDTEVGLGDTAEDLLGGRGADDGGDVDLGDVVEVQPVDGESVSDVEALVAKAAKAGRERRSKRKKRTRLRTPEEYAELLQSAHRHRMGKDYYAFLGVDPTSSLVDIKKAYGRLARRCKKARATDGLSDEAQELAKEMLNAARRVWLTLSDDALRAAYNRRLDGGEAPVVLARQKRSTVRLKQPGSDAPPARSAGRTETAVFDQAKTLMTNGDHERARKLLERARRDDPSSPNILANLGWCTWMVQGRTTGDVSEAEEFLRLAVAFDARHTDALEFLARIAVERGDADTARTRVKALLRVVPSSSWGNQALRGLADATDGDSSSSGRLRFWKKRR